MNNARKDLLSRFHQLMANDRNAADIYSSLSKSIKVSRIADQLGTLAREEAGHMTLNDELIRLLKEESSE